MIRGVTTGFKFRMRLAYKHFPIMTNIINGNKTIEIKNFIVDSDAKRETCKKHGKINNYAWRSSYGESTMYDRDMSILTNRLINGWPPLNKINWNWKYT